MEYARATPEGPNVSHVCCCHQCDHVRVRVGQQVAEVVAAASRWQAWCVAGHSMAGGVRIIARGGTRTPGCSESLT